MIGEQRAVRAFLRGEELVRAELEVEVRTSPSTSDPRSGSTVAVPPLVILWTAERPLAVRLRSVVAVSRFALMPRVASLLESEAYASGFAVERMPEAGLWRLFAQPPRPRPVGR
ncbi:MAG: hypothetical protein ACRDL0_16430 [Thermoleophilaceae bacterium]